MKRSLLTILAPLAALAASPAALAGAPSDEALRAGRVEELNLMLNSVALRCNTIGINLQPQYERFSASQQTALARAQDALNRHFDVQSARDLHADFDRFHIRILNFYGTGRTDAQSCDAFAQLMDRLADADGNGALLGQIAEIMVPDPMFESR